MFRRRFLSEPDPGRRRSRGRSRRRALTLALGYMIALTLGLLTGCSDAEQPSGYGLRLVEIRMTSEALAELRHGAYTETPVPCQASVASVQSRCQIQVAGATTRDDLKKNFDLELAQEHSGRSRHRLSAMSGDPSGMRTLLALASLAIAGLDVPRAEPVALWLNDEYLGLYLLLEPIDADFFAQRDDRVIALYKARNLRASLESTRDLELAFAKRVDEANHSDLRALVASIDQAARGEPHRLDDLIDAPEVLRYMAAAHFIHNWDGIFNNYFLARSASEPRFRVLAWDLDQTFGSILSPGDGELFESNALMRHLYDDERHRYLEELRRLNRLVTPAVFASLVDEFGTEIRRAYEHDAFLNGTSLTEQSETLKLRAERQHEAISKF